MSSDPSKTSGKWESTKGSMKDTLGHMTGSTNLQQSGQQQRSQGQAEYDQARGQGYAEGTQNRAGGYMDSTIGAMKGDQTKQAEGNARREAGTTQQNVNWQ